MKKLLAIFAIMVFTITSYSQETIDVQRPTLTESYTIINQGVLQFENGVDYLGTSSTFNYGTFVRGGISERVELRIFTDYTNVNTMGAKFIAIDHNMSDWGIGASFVYNKVLGDGSDDLRVAFTKSFDNVFTTYNFGYNTNLSIYHILLVGTSMGDKCASFIEYYNDITMNRIHGGITYIPQRDIQLDINGGWMDIDEWYIGGGISFRIR